MRAGKLQVWFKSRALGFNISCADTETINKVRILPFNRFLFTE